MIWTHVIRQCFSNYSTKVSLLKRKRNSNIQRGIGWGKKLSLTVCHGQEPAACMCLVRTIECPVMRFSSNFFDNLSCHKGNRRKYNKKNIVNSHNSIHLERAQWKPSDLLPCMYVHVYMYMLFHFKMGSDYTYF